MKFIHPSELEIQECALSKSECPTAILKHIESCADCSAEVQAYKLLFSEIDRQTAPVINFDISTLVIPQLTRTRTRMTVERFIAGFLMIFAACCIGIPVFIYRRNILYMFNAIPPFFIYAIIGSTSVIIIIKIMLLLYSTNKKIIINFILIINYQQKIIISSSLFRSRQPIIQKLLSSLECTIQSSVHYCRSNKVSAPILSYITDK